MTEQRPPNLTDEQLDDLAEQALAQMDQPRHDGAPVPPDGGEFAPLVPEPARVELVARSIPVVETYDRFGEPLALAIENAIDSLHGAAIEAHTAVEKDTERDEPTGDYRLVVTVKVEREVRR